MDSVRREATIWRLGTALVLLGMLFAIGSTLAERLETRADKTIRGALDQEGLAWVKVEMDGREAQLSGTRTTLGQGSAALSVARDAECVLVLIVRIPCASRVSADFGDYDPPNPVDADLQPQASARS